ncbi:MAG: putative RND superfamily exporter protein [Flavobacteriales bacterium]
MEEKNANLHTGITRYANFIIRFKWLVACLSIVVCIGFLVGAQHLRPTNDYRVFFSDDNPHLLAFDKQQKVYTKNDNIVFVITPKEGEVFDQEVLAAIEDATAEARKFPFVLRVDSVSNFQYSRSFEDDLIVGDLVEDARSLSDIKLSELRSIALQEPFLVGQLLNDDASVTALNITFQMPDEALGATPGEVLAANPVVVEAARALKAEIEANYPVEIRLTGIIMLSNAFFEASMLDMSTLIPAMFAVIVLVMMVMLIFLGVGTRTAGEFFATTASSVAVTFVVLLLMILAIGTGMGAGGWAGIMLTPPSFSAPTIIMTLAVADSIHFLVTMYAGMRKGMNRYDAIRYSLRLNFSPILLTSITTAIGFLSMNFSDTPPFHDLGNITAVGVMAAFFLSVTFLPALMAIIPVKVAYSDKGNTNFMDRIGDFVIRKRRIIFAAAAVLSIGLVSAIPLNHFDDNFVGYFSKNIEFRNDTDYVNENLTGIYQIQYSLDAGEDYGVSDPEFLQKTNDFVDWFRGQPEVLHVNSFTDTFKRINKNMHSDDPSHYKLPDDREMAAQYLLLYELSLPEGLDLNNQMDIGKSSTQIIVTLKDMPSSEIARVSERGQKWLKDNNEMTAYGVGPSVMFAYISATNMRSMLLGTFVAIIVISILIMISLKSLRIGFISLVPNLLPLAASFGLWGILIGEVNVAVSMVTGMALGIVVDDSVHFLSKYLRARREDGLDREGAVRYAFSSVGLAIVVTSIILVCGFSVLAMSNFGMNSSMAMLTAIAIAMALIADFLLLPVLLLKLDRKDRYVQVVESPSSNTQQTGMEKDHA